MQQAVPFVEKVIARRAAAHKSIKNIINCLNLSKWFDEIDTIVYALEKAPLDEVATYAQRYSFLAQDLVQFNLYHMDFSPAGLEELSDRLSQCIPDIITVYRGLVACLAYSHKELPSAIPFFPKPEPGVYQTLEGAKARIQAVFNFCMNPMDMMCGPRPMIDITPDVPLMEQLGSTDEYKQLAAKLVIRPDDSINPLLLMGEEGEEVTDTLVASQQLSAPETQSE